MLLHIYERYLITRTHNDFLILQTVTWTHLNNLHLLYEVRGFLFKFINNPQGVSQTIIHFIF